MRHRETDEGYDVPYEVEYIGTGTPPVPPSVGVWAAGNGRSIKFKAITDTTCPSFAHLLKCGEFLPLNPLEIVSEKALLTPGVVDCDLSGATTPAKYWGTDARNPDPFAWRTKIPSVDEAIVAGVTNSAAAKAANGGWDILTFFGELKETLGTVTELTRAMSNARLQMALEARLFKRDPWGRFRSLWLGGRYGVRPIWYDFLAAVEALQKVLDGPLRYNWNKGKAWREVPFDRMIDTGWVVSDVNWEIRKVLSMKGSYRYRGWSAAQLDWLGQATRGALSADGAVTAWELTRMSFVVDRFIDVGSYVGALSAKLRGLTLGTQASIKLDVSGYTYQEYRVRSGRGSGTWGSGRYDFERQSYTRYPVDNPLPPGLAPTLDWAFAVDLLALFLGGERKVQKLLQRR